jgi:hypothetical protein
VDAAQSGELGGGGILQKAVRSITTEGLACCTLGANGGDQQPVQPLHGLQSTKNEKSPMDMGDVLLTLKTTNMKILNEEFYANMNTKKTGLFGATRKKGESLYNPKL